MGRDASEGEEADAVSLRRRLGTARDGGGDAGFPRGEDGGGDAGIALRVDGMRASYGRVRALTGVSFAVERGRICGLVGTNGSGKSTLIKAIMGAVHSTGDVRLLGMDPTSARRRGLVGYVPQNEGVDWDFPIAVEDVVAMGRYGGLGPPSTSPSNSLTSSICAVARWGLCREASANACSSHVRSPREPGSSSWMSPSRESTSRAKRSSQACSAS